ncbi:hypothetical protein [Sporomusa sp.]|uniref:hypothetical protein n=1 Tax=Sporomusa sp. TaxID=2078658 RepID=UPI002C2D89DB|nr:hypothetical protein [Sporomusa sp.]HWR42612.1 hypothetical protein [Sporomusa sp.]
MIHFKKKTVANVIILVLLTFLSGCATGGPKPINESTKQAPVENAVSKESAIMDEFNRLIHKNNVTAEEISKFINENMAAVSPKNVSAMIIALEKNQQLNLLKLQDKFADKDAIQKTLAADYRDELTDSYLNGIQDKTVRDVLIATQNNGYKIETAEGFYFPVIDYSLYKKYRANVTPDIAAYIDIMVVESDKTPVKDAALMIGWEEVLRRAENQERFIKEYGSSAKIEDVKQLLKRYLAFSLYGANNTPLFSYEDKKMVPAAKKPYLEAAFNPNNGSFSKIINEYRAVLKKNDYKLTKEVDEYRKKAEAEFR